MPTLEETTLGTPGAGDATMADLTVEDFRIYGYQDTTNDGRAADFHQLISDATVTRTIDSAPTLVVSIVDPDRAMSAINLMSYRCSLVLDTHAYEMVAVRKSGDTFEMTFEDYMVCEMRRSNTPRKVGADQQSRVEFAYHLLEELPHFDFVTPPIPLDVTHNELARGKDKPTPGQKPEDTWAALTRIFGEVQWRFWVDLGKAFAAPDRYLISLPSAGTIVEHDSGIGDVDYDYDTGKKVASCTFTAVQTRWVLPIGSRVTLGGAGPQAGEWIVSKIERSLFSPIATITVVQPQPDLPEPPHQGQAGESSSANVAGVVTGTLTPPEIAGYAIGAGLAGQSAEYAVAIAMAESGGVVDASHDNDNGTTDNGIWQINTVHSDYDPTRLKQDPAYNAQAMMEISGGGQNWRPWSTYNNGAYQKFMSIARDAVANPVMPGAADQSTAGAAGGSDQIERMVQFALSKQGGPYVWGGTGPTGYDCSGLVQAAAAYVGIQLPRVSSDQWQFCSDHGTAISVTQAIGTRGALLERRPGTDGAGDSGHIAISLGDGQTIEAMGRAYGILKGRATTGRFNRAGLVPGLAYGTVG